MPSSGSGQGTPVPVGVSILTPYDQTEELDYIPNCAVSLSRYAKLVGYEEAAFWGVVFENQHQVGCDILWTENDRMRIQIALAEAQQQIEQLIGYPLCPTWVVGKVEEEYLHDNRWVDQQRYKGRQVTRYPRLIAAGVRATEVIEEDSVVDHGTQLGTVGPLATTATSTDEIHIYYPNSSRRIMPSSITISGGNVTIEIPRYRMVVQDLLNTPEGGIMYEDADAFLGAVDVVRVYNDPSTQGVLVRPHCTNNNCSGGCTECTHTACIYIRNETIGEIAVRPALWDTDLLEWNSRIVCASNYSLVRLNYLCGMRYLNLQAEQAVIKLAHTKLWGPPCSCDTLVRMWERDNFQPDIMTRERFNCPFGPTIGAWIAYKWAKSQASVRADIL